MRTMTAEEWKQKETEEREMKQYLERIRQKNFAEQQSKESVFTRPNESIVDADN